MKHHQRIALLIFGLVLVGGIFWHYTRETGARNVLLSEATAVPVAGRNNAVRVFLKISNAGPPQRIVSASSHDAKSATLVNAEGRGALVVPGQSAASLAADGAHVLLNGVTAALQEGRLLTVTLNLEPAGPVATKALLSIKPGMSHSTHRTMTQMSGAAAMDKMKNLHHVAAGEATPRLKLAAERKPDKYGWIIQLNVENFRFAKDLVDGRHVAGTGHAHLYLNGLKLGRLYRPTVEIGAVLKGKHVVRVTLNTNDHRVYVVDGQPATRTVVIEGSVEN